MADRPAGPLVRGDFIRLPNNDQITPWFRNVVARVNDIQGQMVYLDVHHNGRLLTHRDYNLATMPALIPLAPAEGEAAWLIHELTR